MKEIFTAAMKRKITHFFVLIVIIVYSILLNEAGQSVAVMALIGTLVVLFAFEYFRIERGVNIPAYSAIIKPKERYKLSTIIFFLTAAIICLASFNFRIALAALLMTAVGDTVAATIGRKYGVTLIFRNKSLIGTVSELIVCLIIGFAVLITKTNIYVILTMAFTATLVEMLIDDLDDNLVVPLVTGFIGQLLFTLL
jgi:dolichol kinase